MKKTNVMLWVLLVAGALLAGCTSNQSTLAPEAETSCGLEGECISGAAPTSLESVSPTSSSEEETQTAADDSVVISLKDVSQTAEIHSYQSNGVKVNYIVVLGSDGEVRTAFDACEVCGGSKGYEQVGADVMCIKCGRYFEIDGLGTQNTGAGCWPAYLPHILEGDSIIIKKSDLDKGVHLFA